MPTLGLLLDGASLPRFQVPAPVVLATATLHEALEFPAHVLSECGPSPRQRSIGRSRGASKLRARHGTCHLDETLPTLARAHSLPAQLFRHIMHHLAMPCIEGPFEWQNVPRLHLGQTGKHFGFERLCVPTALGSMLALALSTCLARACPFARVAFPLAFPLAFGRVCPCGPRFCATFGLRWQCLPPLLLPSMVQRLAPTPRFLTFLLASWLIMRVLPLGLLLIRLLFPRALLALLLLSGHVLLLFLQTAGWWRRSSHPDKATSANAESLVLEADLLCLLVDDLPFPCARALAKIFLLAWQQLQEARLHFLLEGLIGGGWRLFDLAGTPHYHGLLLVGRPPAVEASALGFLVHESALEAAQVIPELLAARQEAVEAPQDASSEFGRASGPRAQRQP
mmetsp:Transcript_88230/g.249999  ORF Transcript_88230/g.249999 Transcript_88230/m.249999 type:complete len:396 (+) Transcript_88230:1820-3007(+)